jgi:hypothetical protein
LFAVLKLAVTDGYPDVCGRELISERGIDTTTVTP